MGLGTTQPTVRSVCSATVIARYACATLWNGEPIHDRGVLESRLAQAAAQADQPEVHIRPNKLVEYKSVAAVLASAQRLGVTKLGMIGNEQFVK